VYNTGTLGGYGLYADRSMGGEWDRVYASGFNDSGLYVGACRDCEANRLATPTIVSTRIARCTIFRNNRIIGNDNPTAHANTSSLRPATGIGVALMGAYGDLVADNVIAPQREHRCPRRRGAAQEPEETASDPLSARRQSLRAQRHTRLTLRNRARRWTVRLANIARRLLRERPLHALVAIRALAVRLRTPHDSESGSADEPADPEHPGLHARRTRYATRSSATSTSAAADDAESRNGAPDNPVRCTNAILLQAADSGPTGITVAYGGSLRITQRLIVETVWLTRIYVLFFTWLERPPIEYVACSSPSFVAVSVLRVSAIRAARLDELAKWRSNRPIAAVSTSSESSDRHLVDLRDDL
jgi:hypothetical protein